jgi:hypothetical protein
VPPLPSVNKVSWSMPSARLPDASLFAVRGLDTDNDSAFMSETLHGYCEQYRIEWTARALNGAIGTSAGRQSGCIVFTGVGRLPIDRQILPCPVLSLKTCRRGEAESHPRMSSV